MNRIRQTERYLVLAQALLREAYLSVERRQRPPEVSELDRHVVSHELSAARAHVRRAIRALGTPWKHLSRRELDVRLRRAAARERVGVDVPDCTACAVTGARTLLGAVVTMPGWDESEQLAVESLRAIECASRALLVLAPDELPDRIQDSDDLAERVELASLLEQLELQLEQSREVVRQRIAAGGLQ